MIAQLLPRPAHFAEAACLARDIATLAGVGCTSQTEGMTLYENDDAKDDEHKWEEDVL